MRHTIACYRCGHTEAHSTDAGNDWDEINRTLCGEFIATRDHDFALGSRNYQLHALSLSIEIILEMSRKRPTASTSVRLTSKVAA
ncbi:hypothetical protein GCM10009038_37010 [Salinicola rhizosphaerae]|uniref:Uncharacterized protein n=1 Tax=Salinicola rhizosphaerae TaxID=1443141 RepID=A0ABQ3EH73_9GAMM|nr:hypothetical protein GCM10009038_37010 [Salinicola rhizosphaerae]